MATTPPGSGQTGTIQGIIDAIEQGFKGNSDSAAGAVASSAYSQASDLFDHHEGMVNAFGDSSSTFEKMYEGVKEIQHNFYGMASASGEALSAIFKNQGELIAEYQGIIGTNLLQIHATRKGVTADDMADLTLYQRALDFNKGQTQNFLERQFALTGEANDDLLKQTLAYAKAIEDTTGISSKIIAENVSGMMSDIRTFGNMTVEEMSEAAAAIAEVGLQVNDVAGLVKKFSTFEGAADSVSKLTQVFGVQMDTMKYMTASFESPQDMLAMIQEDFERAGVDMADMDMAQKRLLADTTGMSISAIESLLGEAGSGLSDFTTQIDGATAGVGTTEIDDVLSRSSGDIAKLNQMGNSVEDGLRIAAERSRQAIGSVFSEGIRELADKSTSFSGHGIRLINIAGRAMRNEVGEKFGITGPEGIHADLRQVIVEGAITVQSTADRAERAVAGGENEQAITIIGEGITSGAIETVTSHGGTTPATPVVAPVTSGLAELGAQPDAAGTQIADIILPATQDDRQDAAALDTLSVTTENRITDEMERILVAAVEDIRESQVNPEPIQINLKNTDGSLQYQTEENGQWQNLRVGV